MDQGDDTAVSLAGPNIYPTTFPVAGYITCDHSAKEMESKHISRDGACMLINERCLLCNSGFLTSKSFATGETREYRTLQ